MNLKNEEKLKLYEEMVYIRLFEGRLMDQFKTGAIPGFVHLGLGQEACMAGVCYSLGDGDTVGATHREHGVLLCRGSDPNKVMAEIYGKSGGMCKGKGGSMHVCDLEKGCLGNNAILGPGQTIINGYAYANKVRKNGKVAVSMFGDGASNRGEFHEGMNFAAIWNLPTIFVVQDNGYALSTSRKKTIPVENIADRAVGYGMAAETVDGNDVEAVTGAMARAAERARNGEGPTLLELKTYRWRGHFEGDPQPYQPKDEIDSNVKENDPIIRYEKVLFDQGLLNEESKKQVWDKYTKIVDEAQKFSEESPQADLSEVYTDVFYA